MALLGEGIEHLESKLNWITATINQQETEALGGNTSMETALVREIYDTDPGKCIKWYIDKKETKECPIDTDVIEEKFTEKWGQSQEFTLATGEDAEFLVERVVNAEMNDVIIKKMKDPKTFSKVMKTRSPLSASGIDGISYPLITMGGDFAAYTMARISQMMMKTKRSVSLWKDTKSILIYKKGDAKEFSNWRPISITSCFWRIWACALANSFQDLQDQISFLSNSQKGFIRGVNGCFEHSAIINELIYDAQRNRKDIFVMALDLKDAFGSVSHKALFDTMRKMGFSEDVIHPLKDAYEDSQTIVYKSSTKTNPITIRKGVKQGCPLSPILFNMALNPLLEELNNKHLEEGYSFKEGYNVVQAYADDLILLSDNKANLIKLIHTVERFMSYMKISINPSKCIKLGYVQDGNRRTFDASEIYICNEVVPTYSLQDTITYLGTQLGVSKIAKLKTTSQTINQAIKRVEKIGVSALRLNQKIDCVKRWVLPSIDFILENGEVKLKLLSTLDRSIRVMINSHIGASGTPKEFFTTSWKDGGLGILESHDRKKIMNVRAIMSLINSRNAKTVDIITALTQDEAKSRKVEQKEDSDFLDWGPLCKDGRNTTAVRAFRSAAELHVKVKIDEKMQAFIQDKVNHRFDPIFQAREVAKVLTEVNREAAFSKLISHPMKGHTFVAMKDNPSSNWFIGHPQATFNDNIVRFALQARTNSLPVGALLRRRNTPCPMCGLEGTEHTLCHRLNGCKGKALSLMTERHNKVSRVLVDAIGARLKVIPRVNSTMNAFDDSLPEDLMRLKPDISWMDEEGLHMIEITVPYDQKEGDDIVMNRKRREKKEKYEPLRRRLQQDLGIQVKLHVIIVSSLGVVHKQTYKELSKLLKYQDKEVKKVKHIATDISAAALRGSFVLFYNHKFKNGLVPTADDIGDMHGEEEEEEQSEQEILHAIQEQSLRVQNQKDVHDPRSTQESQHEETPHDLRSTQVSHQKERGGIRRIISTSARTLVNNILNISNNFIARFSSSQSSEAQSSDLNEGNSFSDILE